MMNGIWGLTSRGERILKIELEIDDETFADIVELTRMLNDFVIGAMDEEERMDFILGFCSKYEVCDGRH